MARVALACPLGASGKSVASIKFGALPSVSHHVCSGARPGRFPTGLSVPDLFVVPFGLHCILPRSRRSKQDGQDDKVGLGGAAPSALAPPLAPGLQRSATTRSGNLSLGTVAASPGTAPALACVRKLPLPATHKAPSSVIPPPPDSHLHSSSFSLPAFRIASALISPRETYHLRQILDSPQTSRRTVKDRARSLRP